MAAPEEAPFEAPAEPPLLEEEPEPPPGVPESPPTGDAAVQLPAMQRWEQHAVLLLQVACVAAQVGAPPLLWTGGA